MATDLAAERGPHPENKTHGLTSWLKAKFFGPKADITEADKELEAALSDLKKVGRYEIVDKLGQGSMGLVYLGKDPYIKRDVAIKISRPSRGLGKEEAEKYKEKFFKEAQSAGRLTHPNIVSIYDAGIEGEFCYITMEYIDGPTLQRFCRKVNLLPVSKVLEIIFVVCRALDYAHRNGIVHRDIKPSNIMLNSSGAVKITDFGIAHVDTSQSSPSGLVGSPCYMSPEQVKEEPIIEKSDIFSLGCVLYELLTGVKAFPGDNYFSILYKITHEDPIPITKLRPELPDILQRIVSKALAKRPIDRYETCLDLAYDLRVALRGIKEGVKRPKTEDVVDYVRQVPFFASFTRDQVREILMASNLVKVPKGKVVVSEGEIDDSFYIILSGSAAVMKDRKTLATIDRGECFGEMAYLSGQTRAATVVATSDSILMKISATLLDRSPVGIQLLFLKQFAITLLKRLSKSNQEKT
ncbi:MAG: protein kinase [Deltaproteobacteria bacterium]|nr:protein kinase [Deltaproteobacteria bacterium]MBW1930150.1 protein kinase [Deltaproteobacteria bacterium]MBW2026597.1 protein kinase [Deltaproteobacteria bacterium]MBW2126447.1 protein kinase [Deltaproteobacteria bacterium]RLB18705.1 MAG: cyclic nucleotide-binding protein [Deltaproteobacteria bacterium]